MLSSDDPFSKLNGPSTNVPFAAAEAHAEMAFLASWQGEYLAMIAECSVAKRWSLAPAEARAAVKDGRLERLLPYWHEAAREQQARFRESASNGRRLFRQAIFDKRLTLYGKIPGHCVGLDTGIFVEMTLSSPPDADWIEGHAGAIAVANGYPIRPYLDRRAYLDWTAQEIAAHAPVGEGSAKPAKAKMRRESATRNMVLRRLAVEYGRAGTIGLDSPARAAKKIAWAAINDGLFDTGTSDKTIVSNLTTYIRRYREEGYIEPASSSPLIIQTSGEAVTLAHRT